jgi:hypothetical protein
MVAHKLEEKKATTSSSINVPTYLRLDPYLGFFCGSKFVGYVDVP